MRTLSRDIGSFEGKEVELVGWVNVRRDHGKLIFIDLRDRSGIAQIVFTPLEAGRPKTAVAAPSARRPLTGLNPQKDLFEQAEKLRPEWVIRVWGTVGKRPKGMENPKIPNGEYEVSVSSLEILAEAKTPPFDLSSGGTEVGEEVRMKYRYLDLRRPRLQRNLRERAKVVKFIRDFLSEREFTEIETPILGKSTPEGARDYLVPSRLHPGKFYALPQSPQQYKQLLMVAGFEKYFQITKCFRDEDTRGDRQPEFTQLDLEVSFASQDEILNLTEELFTALVEKLYPDKKIMKKPFPRITYEETMEKYNSDRPDLRPSAGSGQVKNPNELAFAFIVDFPAFEWKEQDPSRGSGQGKGRWDAVHHPFTQPKVKDAQEFKSAFKEDPSKILAYQYDLVLNGYEIGGGSIRIHDPALLQAVFEAMGNSPEKVQENFGHMLEAFEYGVPPHGGIAPGLDRFVMILQNEPNIREVVAFPKTGDGRDLMMDAPSEIEKEQLEELRLRVKKEK